MGFWGQREIDIRPLGFFFFLSLFHFGMNPWKILNHYYRILEMFNSFFFSEQKKGGGEEREREIDGVR